MLVKVGNLLGLLLVLGCGGKTEREPAPGGNRTPPPVSTEPSSGSSASPGHHSSDWDAGDSLGNCEPGFDRYDEPQRHCNWVVGDQCYEDKLEACACACPTSGNTSNCYSGWPVDDGAVDVYCY